MEGRLEKRVLCVANSYLQKYYFNPLYSSLPGEIQKELKLLCVAHVEEAGGILSLEFNERGRLQIKTMAHDHDFYYDEIESGILVGRLQREQEELLSRLELFSRLALEEGRRQSAAGQSLD